MAFQNPPYRAAHPRMTIGGSAPPPPGGNNMYFSNGASNARGVAIIITDNYGYSAGEFQALQLIVLAVFGAVD